MEPLTLKISLEGGTSSKKIQFDRNMTVIEACDLIEKKFGEALQKQALGLEYGLLINSEDTNSCIWLDPDRKLDSYSFLTFLNLEYRCKGRYLRVRYLSDTIKTILVDDSKPVYHIMSFICVKFHILNHYDYGIAKDYKHNSIETVCLTDDEVVWIDPRKTLRQLGISEKETILLRRRLHYTIDLDYRDAEQINLLYEQAKIGIFHDLNPVNQKKAVAFAGLQAQIQFGDYEASKFTSGKLDLKEFLPEAYTTDQAIEHKIYNEHKKHEGMIEVECKLDYVTAARSLPTFGATYFAVIELCSSDLKSYMNERRLIGITNDYLIILDEHTRKKLNVWPYTNIRGWRFTPRTLDFDFGEYAETEYHLYTTEAKQIQFLMNAYINLGFMTE